MTDKPTKHVIGDIKTVAATVNPSGEPRWKMDVNIPDISPKYATPLYIDRKDGVPGPDPGKYEFHLEQAKLKDGKDGSKSWDYYYNVIEFAPHSGRPVSRPAGTQPSPMGGITESEIRDINIRRQVALKAAVDFTAGNLDAGIEDVLVFADKFVAWLAGEATPQSNEKAPDSNGTPAPSMETPEQAKAFESLGGEADPDFKNVGELLTRALKEFGIDRRGVTEIAGTQQLGGEDLRELWKKIVASQQPK